jgi:probable rRNA maturation factor
VTEDDPPLDSVPGHEKSARCTAPEIYVVATCAGWGNDLADPAAVCRMAVTTALYAAGFSPLFTCIEIGVRLADNMEVRRLNRRYRGRDTPTNVLSFPATDCTAGTLPTVPAAGAPLPLGDIVLAYQKVCAEAKAQGISFADHVRRLVVHGTLHLVGFDHERDADRVAMERIEAIALSRLQASGNDTSPGEFRRFEGGFEVTQQTSEQP